MSLPCLRVVLALCAIVLSGSAGARAASGPVRPNVLVVATFEFGDPRDAGSRGEARAWVVRDHLTHAIEVPGLIRPVYCDASGAECLLITGIGKANAASSMVVAGTSPLLDLRHSYVILAGIAGTSPWEASLGSAAWARYVVDGDVSNEIDPREPGAPKGFARSRFGCYGVPWCAKPWRTNTEVFTIDPQLARWAYATSRHAVLADAPSLATYRKHYAYATYGARSPAVDACDVIGGDAYFAGAISSRLATWWVRQWTAGRGRYCMTSMEDSGFMTGVTRLVAMGRLAPAHALDLRAASDYDQQYPGSTAQAALGSIDHTGGFTLALDNAYRAGEPVVQALRAGVTPP